MSSDGYRVIDTDSHIREYVDVDRMYGPYIDPEYRESYGRLSLAVAKRREAGRPTALFMHPEAIIETSDESRPSASATPSASTATPARPRAAGPRRSDRRH